MDKAFILKSANKLQQVSPKAAEEYQRKADVLVAEMNLLMLERPEIESLVGVNNLNMMKDNHANHARFMISVFLNYNAEVLVDTVLWVFRAYRSHGFSTNYWSSQLSTWIPLLKDVLSEETGKEVTPYYEWMLINIPIFVKLSDEKLEAPDALN